MAKRMLDNNITASNSKNITGRRFGRLIVKSLHSINSKHGKIIGESLWLCECDCNKSVIVKGVFLKKGDTKSCGCLRLDRSRAAQLTHGKSGSQMYHAWYAMIQRCEDKEHISYKNYGGRGIYVCPRWKDFSLFLADMGERPTGHSIDRYPDNNGPYSPENCRWATRKEQNRNKRNNSFVSWYGQTKSLSEWSEVLSFSLRTLSDRYQKRWSDKEILFGKNPDPAVVSAAISIMKS